MSSTNILFIWHESISGVRTAYDIFWSFNNLDETTKPNPVSNPTEDSSSESSFYIKIFIKKSYTDVKYFVMGKALLVF